MDKKVRTGHIFIIRLWFRPPTPQGVWGGGSRPSWGRGRPIWKGGGVMGLPQRKDKDCCRSNLNCCTGSTVLVKVCKSAKLFCLRTHIVHMGKRTVSVRSHTLIVFDMSAFFCKTFYGRNLLTSLL
jgi:hypothetical protein